VDTLGVNADIEPLMTLCFMSLAVIPALKLTDSGLFDTALGKIVPVSADVRNIEPPLLQIAR
jgi:adenine deaminase